MKYYPDTMKKKLWLLLVVTFIALSFYLFVDYKGPSEIQLYPDRAFGFACLRAKELIVQEYDKHDNLWATRGMIVYKLKPGDDKFIRVAHVPTSFSIFWLRNFSLIRRLTVRPECIEIVVNDKGDICAISAGRIWYLSRNAKKFKETFEVTHYGFGDQGVRNDGIINTNDTSYYFGEYFQNFSRETVKVFKSLNDTMSWEAAYEFGPGQIRHIHSIQEDPYSKKLWICTGDSNEGSMIAWSDDCFDTLIKIGEGSQLWRACQLVFTENDIYWGTDTNEEDVAGIYKLDKETKMITKLVKAEGQFFFGTRLANGAIVLSTDREGTTIESDDKTRLFIIINDKIVTVDCGTWNHNKPGFWFKYAMLRFQRNQGSHSLAMTCLNQKEFRDGELILIKEEELRKVVEP